MKLITINLRNNSDRWPERFSLIVDEILKEKPDIIALQEVAHLIDQANMISDAVNRRLNDRFYQSFVVKGWGPEGVLAEAILSCKEKVDYWETRLPKGGRVAQCLCVSENGRHINIVNTHLHHLPKDNEQIRFSQVQFLLEWMSKIECKDQAWVLMGDMNATPNSKTIKYILNRFASAFLSVHGTEPDFTFPTPMVMEKSDWNVPRAIDYIFYSRSVLKVHDAYLAFKNPHPKDATLYPSDHFGVTAIISFTL